MGFRAADYEKLIACLENDGSEEIADIRKEVTRCLRDALQRIDDLEREVADMRRAVQRAATETNVARDA